MRTGRRIQQPKNPEALSGIEHPTVLLHIARRGLSRFISHLDWIVLLQQAVFRARLPIVLTEGFNKKLKAKYSPPLPTGAASEAEYAQIWLSAPIEPEAIFTALAPKLPPDIVLLGVMPLTPPVPRNPWKSVTAARYRLAFAGTLNRESRAGAIALLERFRASPPAADFKREKALRVRGAAFGGDEDLMGLGGETVAAVRSLFDEAGDPRDLDRAEGHGRSGKSPGDRIDLREHDGKVMAVEGAEAFLAGQRDDLIVIGAFNPNLTLHPMRLCLALEDELGLGAPPIATKEALLQGSLGAWSEFVG